MKKINLWLEKFLVSPAHPVIFSTYYILKIYAFNIYGVLPKDMVRSLFISVTATILILLLLRILTKNIHTAAFMSSFLLFMFFFYEAGAHLITTLKINFLAGNLSIIWAVITIFILLLYWKNKTKTWSKDAIAGVNIMSIILLLFPLTTIIRYTIVINIPAAPAASHAAIAVMPKSQPDVYYIILDSYGRRDAIQQYGYDNSEFIQSLNDLGFYVAECSQSNYSFTSVSLASSLNMDYLQTISDGIEPENDDLLGVINLLQNNAVRENFSQMGYKTIAFASGFIWAEWRDADSFISPKDGPVNEFEVLTLLSSYARVLHDLDYVDFSEMHTQRYRARTNLVLNSLDSLVDEPGPKFVFVHLIVPHAPFAFDENGNPANPHGFKGNEGYTTQVKFIDKFLLPKLKNIIEQSSVPPIIILQGDHGPLNKDLRMKILNAYYLPGHTDILYPEISPVNSFRVIFNTYFGTAFPLLDDVSYYSNGQKYNFDVVPASCP